MGGKERDAGGKIWVEKLRRGLLSRVAGPLGAGKLQFAAESKTSGRRRASVGPFSTFASPAAGLRYRDKKYVPLRARAILDIGERERPVSALRPGTVASELPAGWHN